MACPDRSSSFHLVGPLTDPTAFGGTAEAEVRCGHSLIPGYGFSDKPSATGWDPDHIAAAWVEAYEASWLRQVRRAGRRLGCDHHRRNRVLASPELLGIHTTWPVSFRTNLGDSSSTSPYGIPAAGGDFARGEPHLRPDNYLSLMVLVTGGNDQPSPQTLFGIADSPIGLASWMLDHDAESYEDVTHPSWTRARRKLHAGPRSSTTSLDLVVRTLALLDPPHIGDPSDSLTPRASRSPLQSPRSLGRSTRCRGAGPRRRTQPHLLQSA